MSNTSEHDDSSTHEALQRDNAGGNLIGVDNPASPALVCDEDNHDQDHLDDAYSHQANNQDQLDCFNEPPLSAASNRSKSNNPFLSADDNDGEIFPSQQQLENANHSQDHIYVMKNNLENLSNMKIDHNDDYGYATRQSSFAYNNNYNRAPYYATAVAPSTNTMNPHNDLDAWSIYGSLNHYRDISDDMLHQQAPVASTLNHPAISLSNARSRDNITMLVPPAISLNRPDQNPLYENHESLKIHHLQQTAAYNQHMPPLLAPSIPQSDTYAEHHHLGLPLDSKLSIGGCDTTQSSIVAVDSDSLPPGWERVIDKTHGTYYIDHNTQRTQYERPYEIELTKGAMGFGFTLVEADNGVLLVRSVIPGGPAYANGTIRPGDILISAVGVSVTGLQHTDIARLFSTFAVGDRARLTFSRSSYVVDSDLVADEYLFSNGTDGNMAVAVKSNYMNYLNTHNTHFPDNSNQILPEQEYELITVSLNRGELGFGFSIRDSPNGQKIKKIQNHEICTNLKQGDILINLNGQDITGLPHKEVVERLKNCPTGQDVSLTVKRKRRFRSKTPVALPTSHDTSINSTPQRNCKTPNLEGLAPVKVVNLAGLDHLNQYNNFMNNDRLVMMQMQQQQQQRCQPPPPPSMQPLPPAPVRSPVYYQMPLYSNSDLLNAETGNHGVNPVLPLPVKPIPDYSIHGSNSFCGTMQNNYYANNEEIALQRGQYCINSSASLNYGSHLAPIMNTNSFIQPFENAIQSIQLACADGGEDEYEYHQVDLDRESTDPNWGIRLIGGAEANRAISIGSIVLGGAASKNGRLKSGDEIISINGINVVGATHGHVVELISAYSNRASLVVRRKRFAEACEVVLERNMDEGFGFVIISSGNCALIGRIIENSPADRCQQLHVKDRIIAVNGRYITPNMQHPEIVNMIKECGSTLRLRIIPADCYTVELIKTAQNDNFGFSMRGGSDFDGTPLYILRVAPDGLARDLLNVGDQIVEINGISTVGMTHKQAASLIKNSDLIVKLKLRRNYVTPPSLLVDSPRALQRLNQVTQNYAIEHRIKD